MAFLDHQRPLAFAHRGGPAHHPENSWPAFTHAVSLGYTYLETDVHATADGVLVAFHDRTLDRITDSTGTIARMPYREVAAARIAGREPIPLLEELLAAWPEARFNIDVKDGPAIRPLARVLARANAWDRVCVCSFSAARLRATRRVLDRPVCMSLSPAGLAAVRLSRALGTGALLARLAAAGMCCAQVPAWMATRSFVRRAHGLGLPVHVWTVNDRTEMTCLLDMGADGIMTDETVLLRDVLAARGEWRPIGRQGAAV